MSENAVIDLVAGDEATSHDCSERHRLTLKVIKTVGVVEELKDRQNESATKHETICRSCLDQARTAQRNAERTLREHIKQHGCLTLNLRNVANCRSLCASGA